VCGHTPATVPFTPMRVPSLRRHKSGNYFVRWGGRDHYLGRERVEAQRAYLKALDEWRQWAMARVSIAKPKRHALLIDVAERFIDAKRTELGRDAERYYRKHLNRFLHLFGEFRANDVRVHHL